MLIHCKTSKAVLLLGVSSQDDVMRFPSNSEGLLGLVLDVDTRLSINEQLMDAVRKFPELTPFIKDVDIEQNFWTNIDHDGDQYTLYVATIHNFNGKIEASWKTLPEYMSCMTKDRRRLAYLRAWQVLTGALTNDVQAIDFNKIEDIIKS